MSPVVVSDAWSRPATGVGVVYLTIVNRGTRPDRLVGAASSIAASTELHESSESQGKMNGMTMSGVMSMHRVRSVTIPAQRSLAFRPGSYHIMLIGLHRDLTLGQPFVVRLHFASAGWRAVTVHVRPM